MSEIEKGAILEKPTAAVLAQEKAPIAFPPSPPDSWGRKFRIWLRGSLPTAFVLAGLVGLGWWGHQNGWVLPSFASLVGREVKEHKDWCEDHGVPESQCIECYPGLMPRERDFGWCKVHGVSSCPLEHPEVAQLKGPIEISPTDLDRAQRALALVSRQENSRQCKRHPRRIQFPSREALDKAGIDVERVEKGPIFETLLANGEVTYDQTRVARLSSRVPGTVLQVPRKVGDPVQRGEVLALVDAAEAGRAKADFLQAVIQVDLKSKTLAERQKAAGALPERQIRETEAALQEAQIRLLTAEQALINLGLPIRAEEVKGLGLEPLQQRLQFLGLPESLRRDLDPRTTTANLIPILSPVEGVVVTREVVAGEVVDATKVLFVVADVRHMWLALSLRQEDAARVAIGQPVRFHPDGFAGEISGEIRWISTAVDEKTRTLNVRADLLNPEGRLRAYTFGQGLIILREEKDTLLVPSEAIQWDGHCHVVFVRDKNFLDEGAPKVFHVRTVRLGAKDDQHTEIIAGLLPGELVATRGSGSLAAVLRKADMGVG
jgi:cobalt-zinc-cadmium efflux system membrane fusion protein